MHLVGVLKGFFFFLEVFNRVNFIYYMPCVFCEVELNLYVQHYSNQSRFLKGWLHSCGNQRKICKLRYAGSWFSEPSSTKPGITGLQCTKDEIAGLPVFNV